MRLIVWEPFFAITSCQGKQSLELKPVSVSNPISKGPLSTVVHGRLGVVEQDGYFSEVNPHVPPTFRGVNRWDENISAWPNGRREKSIAISGGGPGLGRKKKEKQQLERKRK